VAGRMMCTLCFETAEPETILAGSDLVEIFGWLCLAAPGWLYCWWRHALRTKACPACGGQSLIREARAAQCRVAPASNPARIRSGSGGVVWPRALARPRERLLHGGIASALLAATAFGPSSAMLAVVASFGVYEIGRVLRTRPAECRAWDHSGRSLRIELV